jgi:hypothetical protein
MSDTVHIVNTSTIFLEFDDIHTADETWRCFLVLNA